MAKKLRLLGPRLVVFPIPPPKVSTVLDLEHPTKYWDDRRSWSVLQVGPGVNDIEPGDKVITHGNEEPLHEFSDRVRIIDAKAVIMVLK